MMHRWNGMMPHWNGIAHKDVVNMVHVEVMVDVIAELHCLS
jgi:hypothetical protein